MLHQTLQSNWQEYLRTRGVGRAPFPMSVPRCCFSATAGSTAQFFWGSFTSGVRSYEESVAMALSWSAGGGISYGRKQSARLTVQYRSTMKLYQHHRRPCSTHSCSTLPTHLIWSFRRENADKPPSWRGLCFVRRRTIQDDV